MEIETSETEIERRRSKKFQEQYLELNDRKGS